LLRNKDVLDSRFETVTLAGQALIARIDRALENGFIDKETYDLFTTLNEGLGAQLEALQLLASEIEASGS
jgi:hypothetical protein